jgi:hypothetical protein
MDSIHDTLTDADQYSHGERYAHIDSTLYPYCNLYADPDSLCNCNPGAFADAEQYFLANPNDGTLHSHICGGIDRDIHRDAVRDAE